MICSTEHPVNLISVVTALTWIQYLRLGMHPYYSYWIVFILMGYTPLPISIKADQNCYGCVRIVWQIVLPTVCQICINKHCQGSSPSAQTTYPMSLVFIIGIWQFKLTFDWNSNFSGLAFLTVLWDPSSLCCLRSRAPSPGTEQRITDRGPAVMRWRCQLVHSHCHLMLTRCQEMGTICQLMSTAMSEGRDHNPLLIFK